MGLWGFVDVKCSNPNCNYEESFTDIENRPRKCPRCGERLKFHIWYR